MDTWLIFIGAGLGGVSRFGISNTFAWLLGRDFPYGTLVVNALGSFLIGLLFILSLDRLEGIANHFKTPHAHRFFRRIYHLFNFFNRNTQSTRK